MMVFKPLIMVIEAGFKLCLATAIAMLCIASCNWCFMHGGAFANLSFSGQLVLFLQLHGRCNVIGLSPVILKGFVVAGYD